MGETLRVGVGESETLAESETVAESETLREGVGETLAEAEGEGEEDGEALAVQVLPFCSCATSTERACEKGHALAPHS